MTTPIPLPKARLEALTDGIFAVTMTLLVLDLKFPPDALDRQGAFLSALAAILDRLDNYVISFLALCVFWVSHARLMRRLRDPDAAFVWLNLGFLLLTTLVPSLSTLVGDSPTHPRARSRSRSRTGPASAATARPDRSPCRSRGAGTSAATSAPRRRGSR